jgi:hypothetical protein
LETLKTNEVQAIVVAAAHLNEIQTITTSAAEYSDVQQITLTTPEGYEIDGKFAVRFPEVQVFSTRAMDADAMGGYFRLGYASYVLPNAATTEYTSCLSVLADQEEVEAALEALSAQRCGRRDRAAQWLWGLQGLLRVPVERHLCGQQGGRQCAEDGS